MPFEIGRYERFALKFTPLEFETIIQRANIYSVFLLKFTPLEFETFIGEDKEPMSLMLKFTPLEFETHCLCDCLPSVVVKIYSVGV